MEEHPLLRAVASWPGRGPTQLAFEALGFSIHRARQNRIIQFCGDQQSDLLNRYWDEVATETMQSLGQGDPDERAFAIQPAYRSAFLDELLPREILSSCHFGIRRSSNACSNISRGSTLIGSFERARQRSSGAYRIWRANAWASRQRDGPERSAMSFPLWSSSAQRWLLNVIAIVGGKRRMAV
jgi:hypothetical protein